MSDTLAVCAAARCVSAQAAAPTGGMTQKMRGALATRSATARGSAPGAFKAEILVPDSRCAKIYPTVDQTRHHLPEVHNRQPVVLARVAAVAAHSRPSLEPLLVSLQHIPVQEPAKSGHESVRVLDTHEAPTLPPRKRNGGLVQ